jgi:hypothetical protein
MGSKPLKTLGRWHQHILDSADRHGQVTCQVNHRFANQALNTLIKMGLIELRILETPHGAYQAFFVKGGQ